MFAITDGSTLEIDTYLAELQTQVVAEASVPVAWDPLPQNGMLDIPELIVSIDTARAFRILSEQEQEILHESLLASVEILD